MAAVAAVSRSFKRWIRRWRQVLRGAAYSVGDCAVGRFGAALRMVGSLANLSLLALLVLVFFLVMLIKDIYWASKRDSGFWSGTERNQREWMKIAVRLRCRFLKNF